MGARLYVSNVPRSAGEETLVSRCGELGTARLRALRGDGTTRIHRQ